MIRVRGVNHIALRISDVARIREFYGKILGLEVVPFPTQMMDRDRQKNSREAVQAQIKGPAPTGGIWFAAGATQLHFNRVARAHGEFREPLRTAHCARSKKPRGDQNSAD